METTDRENQVPAVEENQTVVNGTPMDMAPKTPKENHVKQDEAYLKRHKRNVVIAIICAAVFFVNLVIAVVIAVIDTKEILENSAAEPDREEKYLAIQEQYPDRKAMLQGYMLGNSNVVILPESGPVVTLHNDKIRSAVASPDRQTVVYREEGGKVFVTDRGGVQKRQLADNCESLQQISDTCLLYRGPENTLYRVDFSDMSVTPFCQYADSAICSYSLVSCLYSKENGEVYFHTDSGETLYGRMDSGMTDVLTLFVSDDGSLAAWMESDGDKIIIKDYDNGVVTATAFPSMHFQSASFANRKGFAFLHDGDLYLKIAGRPAKVYTGDGIAEMPMTDYSQMYRSPFDEDTSLYFERMDEKGKVSLFYIAPDGSEEKLMETDGWGEMVKGYYIYPDDEGNVWRVSINKNKMGYKNSILDDTAAIGYCYGGDCLYYIDNVDRTMCYNMKTKEHRKVFNQPFDELYLSADGTVALLFTDLQEKDGFYVGNLWYYENESGTASPMGQNVIADNYLVGSGYMLDTLDPEAYVFYEFTKEKDGEVICRGVRASRDKRVFTVDDVIYG